MGGFAALKVFDFLVGGDGGGLAVDDLWCHNGGTDVSAVQMPQRKFDGQPHGAMGDLLHFQVYHGHGGGGLGEELGQGGAGVDDLYIAAHLIVGLDQCPHEAEAHDVVGADDGLGYLMAAYHPDAQFITGVNVIFTVKGAGVDVHTVLLTGAADGGAALGQAKERRGVDDKADVVTGFADGLLRSDAAGGLLIHGNTGVAGEEAIMDNYWNFCFTFGKGGEVAGTGRNDDGGIVYAAGPQVILQVQVVGLVGADGDADRNGIEQNCRVQAVHDADQRSLQTYFGPVDGDAAAF